MRLVKAAPTLLALCEAVVLFNKGGHWTEEDNDRWHELTGTDVATGRAMCDRLRQVIGEVKGVPA